MTCIQQLYFFHPVNGLYAWLGKMLICMSPRTSVLPSDL